MKLNEITTEYSNPYHPEIDIGLLTKSEFLYSRNPTGKSHPSEVYAVDVEGLNRAYPVLSKDISFLTRSFDKLYLTKYDNGGMVISTVSSGPYGSRIDSESALAVIIGDTVYYTVQFPTSILPIRMSDVDGNKLEIVPTNFEKVKYIASYLNQVKQDSRKNIEQYPVVLRRLTVAGEELVIRTESEDYQKDSGHTIVILNSDNQMVAVASNEWGATLLRVAREYRGKNLGRILGDVWYSKNPGFTSGGFSPQGKQNAIKIWSARVRTMLENGWYSHLIKTGQISVNKVKKILSDILPREKTLTAPTKTQQEPLLYTDGVSVFVVYDKKFFDDQDEKYIYAFCLIRDHADKVFAYTLDYEPAYRKLATYVLLELVQSQGEKLWIADKPSDHIDLSGIPGIKVDADGYAVLEKPTVNIREYSRQETRFRNPLDRHGEILQLLLEMAHTKW